MLPSRTHQHTLSESSQTTTGVCLCACGYGCFSERKRKAVRFLGHHYQHITSELNYLRPIHTRTHKHARTHTHGVNELSSPFLCHSAIKCDHPYASLTTSQWQNITCTEVVKVCDFYVFIRLNAVIVAHKEVNVVCQTPLILHLCNSRK